MVFKIDFADLSIITTMGKKSKNAGKKQSKICDKPVSPYWIINRAPDKVIKQYSSLNSFAEIALFADINGDSIEPVSNFITNKAKNISRSRNPQFNANLW